jgi:hypothetical protein
MAIQKSLNTSIADKGMQCGIGNGVNAQVTNKKDECNE